MKDWCGQTVMGLSAGCMVRMESKLCHIMTLKFCTELDFQVVLVQDFICLSSFSSNILVTW